MKALTFEFAPLRLAAAKILGSLDSHGYVSRIGPLRYGDVPDARLLGDDWVVVRTHACGVCGSDVKQVFLDGNLDNPLKAVVSFPHVLGHEMVGTVHSVGANVKTVRAGDRVAGFPWLTCTVRGLPECEACRAGDLTLCANLSEGSLSAGMHAGNCRDVSGGFAEYFPAHEKMCVKIPDTVSFDQAVLADPFSVMLRAVLKAPPARGETVMIVGSGVLGLCGIHIVARLFPGVTVVAVDANPGAATLARQMGAHEFTSASGASLIEWVAARNAAPVRRPSMAMPWIHLGVDKVYDTVANAATLETNLRLLRAKGSLVIVGVASPARFEWTPLYFKEITLVGSSGCGIETFEGRRMHGFAHYFDLVEKGRVDCSAMITHRFRLHEYQTAFVTAREKRRTGSMKVLIEFAD